MNQSTEILVLDLAGNIAVVECMDSRLAVELVKLGFTLNKGIFYYSIANMDARIDITRKLIALDALFSHGRDWSPSNLRQYFSESGFISDKYRTVAWKNPVEVVIGEDQE